MKGAAQLAEQLDAQAVRAARGSGALELELGEILARLFEGDGLADLGFSNQTDYARERLGIAARTVHSWVALARGLATRRILRAALLAGSVSSRKALTVMRAATGEAEAAWTAIAMALRHTELAARVRDSGFDPELDTFAIESILLRMDEAQQDRLDAALAMAGRVACPGVPRWQKLESICQEWLGEFGGTFCPRQADRHREPLSQSSVEETLPDPATCVEFDLPTTAIELDQLAYTLLRCREERTEQLGRALEPIAALKLHQELGYRWFEDYVRERLMISPRGARQRVWLERRMRALPPLREALRTGRITLTKALLVADHATPESIDQDIDDATSTTWQSMDLEATEREDRKNRADGTRRLWAPADAFETVLYAIWSLQAAETCRTGSRPSKGEALARIADHFVAVWRVNLDPKCVPNRRQEVFARQDGLCAVPGCSQSAQHEHHIEFRSQGGSDEVTNLIALCAFHHLRCVHTGRLTVRGHAGERIEWHFIATGEQWTTTGKDDVRRTVRKEEPTPAAS